MKPVICTILKFSLKKGVEKPLQQMEMFFHKYLACFVNSSIKDLTLSAFGEDKKIKSLVTQVSSLHEQ